MTRFNHLGRSLLLTALMLGLNALGLLAITHARHPSHMRANVTHGHHGPSRRASRNGNRGNSSLQAHVDHVHSHVAPRSKPVDAHAAAVLPAAVLSFSTQLASEPLADVSVVALGSAPRAPGGARAPPLS